MIYRKVMRGEVLEGGEVRELLEGLLNDKYTDIQTGAILTALSVRGESPREIEEGVRYLREIAEISPEGRGAIDIVGTGGDGLNTINISTASAFIAAAAGARVLKHGNRSVSSSSGSSDLLEALGIDLNNLKDKTERVYKDTGMTFLYAPHYHPALKAVGGVRRELGVRSIFNLMGPLANPSSPDYILLGVYSEELMEGMVSILRGLGIKRGMVVHGVEDGADEISICGTTKVIEISGSKVRRYNIHPEELGLKMGRLEEIQGGGPKENAKLIKEVLAGRDTGAKRDALIINSAAALYLTGRAETLIEGVVLARETIASGRAYSKLQEYVEAVR
ncbi:anthranilate phosphoribosyltransferase [Propionigenium maris DSM 9537]|uniref:Anthranilate phosphoribosyltransferase n=1 Tax=Propionigenium maris DSM 9537 TaxID=1123000 RepID=A0A9W6LMT1_9FUSO|nr:anthranilate phosphoribosyltransferase [Propionigenium maris]GLI55952.1 anthranilate phosphoribosyltransferase [Propionigenium maris DSM 9537]